MSNWKTRNREEAVIFNPAFCGTVLTAISCGYVSQCNNGLPFILSFVTVPLVLHKSTRELLPRTTRTTLSNWVENHQEQTLYLKKRIFALKPYVKEAILFATNHGQLDFDKANYSLTPKVTESVIKRYISKSKLEAKECVHNGFKVGQWFAKTEDAKTILSIWGVRL